MHTYTPENSIFGGSVTNLFSKLCILVEILLGAHAMGGLKSLNDFKFGTFTGRFPSDGVASMAVKGLMKRATNCDSKHPACRALSAPLTFVPMMHQL